VESRRNFKKGKMKAPFIYFGGKSMIAPKIWELLGNPEHYLEPFAGSLAVLLARPHKLTTRHSETVNDKDCIIANVWRALKDAPEETARIADDIVCHVDLMAKKYYINSHQPELLLKMSNDPEYFDTKIAGYYIWASSCWIGSGLTCPTQIPHLDSKGMGIQATHIPFLGHKGIGIQATKIPHLTGDKGINTQTEIYSWFLALSERLKKVRIVNGDWTQILGGDWQGNEWNSIGIYLDPPYSDKANRTKNLYGEDSLDVAHAVREYCIKTSKKHPDWKIVLSGYFEEHQELLDCGFDFMTWKTNGGYGNTSRKKELSQGQKNRKRETLFYTKNCCISSLFDKKL